jgi:hypothetical protein
MILPRQARDKQTIDWRDSKMRKETRFETQMPFMRGLCDPVVFPALPNKPVRTYDASSQLPAGFGQEEAIAKLWAAN